MGLSQKVLRDAVSKDVLFNTLLLKKKKWGGAKTAIPTFVNIFVLYIYTVNTASAQMDIVVQKDLLPNFLLRLCL